MTLGNKTRSCGGRGKLSLLKRGPANKNMALQNTVKKEKKGGEMSLKWCVKSLFILYTLTVPGLTVMTDMVIG